MFVSAIIAAGGSGSRLGGDRPKQLLEIDGVPILQRALDMFERASCVDEIIVALPQALADHPPEYLRTRSKPLRIVAGGARRQDSVANAFDRVAPAADIVVIHDAARPFASDALLKLTVEAARESGAAIAAVQARDTVKEAAPGTSAGGDAIVERTLSRERIFLAQTPQAFRRDVLRDAIALGRAGGADATDEAALAERAGHSVRLVPGEVRNVKITTADDLAGAGFDEPARPLERIGTGYDLHRMVEGRPLILAGVTIPFEKGPIGHSDADVLCHALTDAVLGAGALGDIGRHFPDTDDRWRGAAGLDLLGRGVALAAREGLVIRNVDAVVILERPKLAPHLAAIRANLARVLDLDIGAVSVKGKTNEGLGAVGRGEAIACHAVALLTTCL
jgi:2-C-methyl-D-erythritol 4-phosphate cytidylyltransferase / 2-C-methyl-D-erythritol 2,4-cyclodiphosphate synthase